LEDLSNYLVNKILQTAGVHHILTFPSQVNTPASEHLWSSSDLFMIVLTFQVLEYDISKFSNVGKWYSKIKKAIVSYDEIQDAGAAALNQLLVNRPK
jgi:hypothetical protein